jgi:hypothetical protein
VNLNEDRLSFRNRNPVPYRLLIWASLIVAALWVFVQVDRGEIEPLFQPTPTSTRSANSYIQEGAAFFEAGNLDASIRAYEECRSLPFRECGTRCRGGRIPSPRSTG